MWWISRFAKDLLLGQGGGVHLVEAGGDAGAAQLPLPAEHDGVAVGSLGDVHRHPSCGQVGEGQRPVLEAAVGNRPHVAQLRLVLHPTNQASVLPLLFSLNK